MSPVPATHSKTKQLTKSMTGTTECFASHKSSCDTFFLIYCKNITNFLFWDFGHVRPLPSKTVMPTCRNFDVSMHPNNGLDT